MLIKLKFDQLYCITEELANYVLLGSKIVLGYEEALWPKKLETSHGSLILTNNCQILNLSLFCNYYCTLQNLLNFGDFLLTF